MKSATALTTPITGLNGTHRDEVAATFYGRHAALNTRCCEYKKNLVKIRSLERNRAKIKNEKCRPGYIESVHKR